MLVMRRRAGESIVIDGGIEIQVLETGPGKVKLGITAPQHISVTRLEARVTREQNIAAASGIDAQAVNGLVRILRTPSKS